MPETTNVRARRALARTRATGALLGLVALVQACASGGSSSGAEELTGKPVSIRYVHYVSGQRLELVNPAHTDRVELYSQRRAIADAGTKVSTDEVLGATLQFFDERGFWDAAQPGPAPAEGGPTFSQALEVDLGGRRGYLLFGKDTEPGEKKRFAECAQAFLGIYNQTYQLQAVDRAPDWETPASPKKAGKAGG